MFQCGLFGNYIQEQERKAINGQADYRACYNRKDWTNQRL